MGDFPVQWSWVRDLIEGGQGHTYVVRRSDGSDLADYVLKRLKNPKREDYFEREIEACEKLDHPNVLKIVEHGKTPKGKPFLITGFCNGGSLGDRAPLESPIEGLRLFLQICAGVAHAHEFNIFHLDIKPANIFLQDENPVVGDFGICFIEDNEYVMTAEGPRGSMYYCAPELRGPKIQSGSPLAAADVYSLGKVLYWIFTGDVYDGHDADYSEFAERRLAERFPSIAEFDFIDELIAGTIQNDPYQRIKKGFSTAVNLREQVKSVVDRIEAGGRALNLGKPLRCLFCARGTYLPYPRILGMWPELHNRVAEKATNPEWNFNSPMFQGMRNAAENFDGSRGINSPVPLILVCQHCGNVQLFRFDLAPEALGLWKP